MIYCLTYSLNSGTPAGYNLVWVVYSFDMKVDGQQRRTIWIDPLDPFGVSVINQRFLPHRFEVVVLTSLDECAEAISNMTVRGAPLIGVAAAYGMYLAALHCSDKSNFESHMLQAADRLLATRPTAVNLRWALDQQKAVLRSASASIEDKIDVLRKNAERIADDDVRVCRKIAEFGLEIIENIYAKNPNRSINILTHCNAGWLCAVDWGTATAPIYQAFNQGIPVHVWVDETRPRNQGASLTAWELEQHGVPYSLITDNAGGHLMQNGKVDLVIVGTDRVTRGGDVANKIGTYLKALAAKANDVPFYVAAPSSSIDWSLTEGRNIPIEERDVDEVRYVTGLHNGELCSVLIAPANAKISNFGFDVTPRHLITGLITERGVVESNEDALVELFPEHRAATTTT